jgi:hypothetical protein
MEIDCKKCGKLKDTSCFSVVNNRKRGYHVWCKECIKIYDHERLLRDRKHIVKVKRERVQKNRKWLKDYKQNKKCERCSENDSICLDFHHIDNSKDYVIANMLGCSIETIKKEIEKCIILCANCHRKEHREVG